MLYREITLKDADKLNHCLYVRYMELCTSSHVRHTHHFAGRFENTYIDRQYLPDIDDVLDVIRKQATELLECDLSEARIGFWFNAMGPGHITQAHHHDENDEQLSAVYYIRVPENSGDLILHDADRLVTIRPTEGKLVMFAPSVVHEVSKNNSDEMRLSVAFNIGPVEK